MTLVFSANQALLSAEAGATYISCFMGRLDDISVDSTAVLREIVETLGPAATRRRCSPPRMRNPKHVVTAAKLGCEVATVPAKVLRQMLDHPLTDVGDREVHRRLAVAARVRRVAARASTERARRRAARRVPPRSIP